ncbi:MAG TPA: hypothetical protein VD966_06795 [Pyrinomonadaceae bacterium]|nr:hypothetical protein [Pyrinomonadaceae bacterium]
MRGTVIHARGHFRRCLEGRNNEGQITVKAIMPVAASQNGTEPAQAQRPLFYVFYYDGKSFAGSRKVVLAKGRRYPNVEHWFISPE